MQDESQKHNRRSVLKLTSGAAAGIFAFSAMARAADEICGLTPAQPEGPFYPDREQGDEDADLTSVAGRHGHPLGEVVYIEGVVSDERCQPIAGALVEIWQASANGRYNHRGDASNPKPIDPNFQYWGQTISDAQGRYRFKTVIPGHYNADTDWIRPPHVHYKVSRRGYHELITQMYFARNQYNSGDRLLRRLSAEEQQRVIVDFASQRHSDGIAVGTFNISLEKVT